MPSPDDIHVTLAPNQNSSAPENERNQTGVPGPIRPNRRISRPKLTIPILRVSTPPNQTPRSPMHTPRITIPITPAGIAPIGQVPHPLGMLQLYPTKAGEFMFKRFEGFKDFTMNTAKSGLSVGEKSAFWIYGKVTAWSRKWFTHIFLFLVVLAYSLLGAIIFVTIEGMHEEKERANVVVERQNLVEKLQATFQDHQYYNNTERLYSDAIQEIKLFEEQLFEHYKHGFTNKETKVWSFWNAVFYCGTIYTTIGYGHISPSTTTGRGITIVYAIFGIPMFLILLADFGKLFTRGIKFIWAFVRRVYYTGSCKKVRRTVPVQEVMKGVQLVYDFATFRRPSQMDVAAAANANNLSDEDREAQEPLQQPNPVQISVDGLEPGTPVPSVFEVDDEFNLPISVAIVILVIYIFCGATIYYIWEDWGFFESFYFVFISMSTIGFGDYVPAHPMYMMASIVYLVFGLALTSMCINVVQEKLSDSFRHASAKIGATIGLQVSDEDGTITPMAPLTAELAEVQTPRITKSSSDIPQGNTLTPPAPQSLSM